MKKLTVIKLISMLIIAFMINSCGEAGCCSKGADVDDDISSDIVGKKIKVVSCDNSNGGTNDCGNVGSGEYYTCIETGDKLVQDINGSTVEIVSSTDDNKKVCVQSGAAHLLK